MSEGKQIQRSVFLFPMVLPLLLKPLATRC